MHTHPILRSSDPLPGPAMVWTPYGSHRCWWEAAALEAASVRRMWDPSGVRSQRGLANIGRVCLSGLPRLEV